MDAVDSAVKQTIDRNQYEIIVVKNFKDFSVDRHLQNNDVLNIFLDSTSGGEKFAAAISRARGRVLSFLDDDDKFTESKLEHVLKAFRNDNLGYLHNAMRIVDAEGNPMRINFPVLSKKSLIVRDRLAGGSIDIMLRTGAWFNSSSISMRKDILTKNIDALGRIRAVTDSFFFYAALRSDFTIMLEPIELTIYKYHNSLSNFSGDLESFVSAKTYLFRRSLQDFLTITDMLEHTPYSDYSLAEASRTKFQLGIVADYPAMRPSIVDFMRIFKTTGHSRLPGSLFFMTAYIISIFSRDYAVKMLHNHEKKRFSKV